MLYNFLGYIMSVLNGNICAPPSWKIFLLETEAIFRRKIHSQLIYEHNAKIKWAVGAAEDRNLNEIYKRKAIQCCQLNLKLGTLSIMLCDR